MKRLLALGFGLALCAAVSGCCCFPCCGGGCGYGGGCGPGGCPPAGTTLPAQSYYTPACSSCAS